MSISATYKEGCSLGADFIRTLASALLVTSSVLQYAVIWRNFAIDSWIALISSSSVD